MRADSKRAANIVVSSEAASAIAVSWQDFQSLSAADDAAAAQPPPAPAAQGECAMDDRVSEDVSGRFTAANRGSGG
jgi:hypothetical protein